MQFQKLSKILIILCLLGFFTTFATSSSAHPRSGNGRYDFALIGALQYTPREELKFPELIQSINNSAVQFVIHNGDIKSGSSLCTDKLFLQRLELFQTFQPALIYVFGDNEWTDCHRPAAGGYDPIERLAKLRELFTQGDRSLGQKSITLTRQSENSQYRKFRENVRVLPELR